MLWSVARGLCRVLCLLCIKDNKEDAWAALGQQIKFTLCLAEIAAALEACGSPNG